MVCHDWMVVHHGWTRPPTQPHELTGLLGTLLTPLPNSFLLFLTSPPPPPNPPSGGLRMPHISHLPSSPHFWRGPHSTIPPNSFSLLHSIPPQWGVLTPLLTSLASLSSSSLVAAPLSAMHSTNALISSSCNVWVSHHHHHYHHHPPHHQPHSTLNPSSLFLLVSNTREK